MRDIGPGGGLGCGLILVFGLVAGLMGQVATPEPLDPMSETRGWTVYKDDRGVTVSLDVIETETGSALEIFYSMEGGEWLGIFKSINRDLSGYKGLRFSFMGLGSANSLEVKLEDGDGTQFGRVMEAKSNASSCKTVDVTFDQLSYWWGGDSSLDWKKVRHIHFALSKKSKTDQGGSGKVMIGKVELLK